MTAVDWGMVVGLALYGIRGMVRGFVRELFSVLAWVLGLAGARWLGPVAARLLPVSAPALLAAAVSFVCVYLLVRVLGYAVRAAVVGPRTQVLDRFLGAVLGLGRGVLVIALVVFLLHWTPMTQTAMWRRSRWRPFVQHGSAWLWRRVAAEKVAPNQGYR